MDDFEKASLCLPDALNDLLTPVPKHADVFLHSVCQKVVETQSVLRGSRFGPPQRSYRNTRIEGICLRSITGSGIREAASHNLTPSAILMLHASLTHRSERAADAEPHVDVSTGLADHQSTMALLSDAVLDSALFVHHDVTSVRLHVAEIGVRRAITSSGSGGSLSCDRSDRVEVVASISVGGRDVTVIRSQPVDSIDIGNLARGIGAVLARRSSAVTDLPWLSVPRVDSEPLVVLPPGWGAVWLHEAIGHQLEADVLVSGNGEFTGRFNQTVGPENVTILDSPGLTGGRVCQTFDDEGTPSDQTILIDRGKLVGTLTDRYSAIRHSLPATGNGRRAHYAQSPRPRMTNLILKPGDVSPADLTANVDFGIEVLEIDHAWFEPESMKVCLHVVESRLIRKGRVEHRLEPLILSASPREMLSNIVGIGSDFMLDTDRGYCVKSGAAIPVGVGQPTVLMSGLNVSSSDGRRSQREKRLS